MYVTGKQYHTPADIYLSGLPVHTQCLAHAYPVRGLDLLSNRKYNVNRPPLAHSLACTTWIARTYHDTTLTVLVCVCVCVFGLDNLDCLDVALHRQPDTSYPVTPCVLLQPNAVAGLQRRVGLHTTMHIILSADAECVGLDPRPARGPGRFNTA